MSSFTRYRPEDSWTGAHWTNKHVLNSQLRNVTIGISSPRNQDLQKSTSRDFNLGISAPSLRNHADCYDNTLLHRFKSSDQHSIGVQEQRRPSSFRKADLEKSSSRDFNLGISTPSLRNRADCYDNASRPYSIDQDRMLPRRNSGSIQFNALSRCYLTLSILRWRGVL